MRILLAEPLAETAAFLDPLMARVPGADVRRWRPGDEEPADILVAWCLPARMERVPPLRAVFCFGAGADQLVNDPRLPDDVPVTRLVDPGQARRMLDYAVGAAFWRLLDRQRFLDAKAARTWATPRELPGYPRNRSDLTIAVLGLGAIGATIAEGLAALGFQVRAWTRSPREAAPVPTFHGPDSLAAAVSGVDVLVNVLRRYPSRARSSARRPSTGWRPPPSSSTSAAATRSTSTPSAPRSRRAASAGPGSTCFPSSRCRSTTGCGPTRASRSPPMSPACPTRRRRQPRSPHSPRRWRPGRRCPTWCGPGGPETFQTAKSGRSRQSRSEPA